MYRPQSAYPLPPAPCDDQRCVYSFDSTNLPVLNNVSFPAGAHFGRIPLRLDKDADFYLRAIATTGNDTLYFRIEDTDGNALSDLGNVIDSTNYELPPEYSDAGGYGVAPLESGAGGVFGPAGGNYVLYIANLSAVAVNLTTFILNLHGVKRYSKEVCKQ